MKRATAQKNTVKFKAGSNATEAGRSGFLAAIERRPLLFGAIAIVGLICLAYYPAARGGFLFDDDLLVTGNELIVGPHASEGLYKIWFTTKAVDYWPVTNTAFWIEWRLFGTNPIGYHVVSLTLHSVESLLLWLILKRLKIPGAFLASLLFAVHPVNVESVAWIASQKNLWAMLFLQLAVLCYLRIELTDGVATSSKQFAFWYGLTLVCFLAAAFGKGSAVVLPGVLALVVYWLRPLRRSDLFKLAPLFMTAVILACVNVWFQTHGRANDFRAAGIAERFVTGGVSVWFYLYKAVLPVDLALIYPKWSVNVGNWLWYAPGIGVIAVSATLAYFELKKKGWARPVFFAWFFFLIALAPFLGLADVGYNRFALVADRYQHLALVSATAGMAAAIFAGVKNRAARGVLAIVAVLFCLAAANGQASLYEAPKKWYEAALAKNPDCWIAYNNLGIVYSSAGREDLALPYFEKSVRLNPEYPNSQHNLAQAYHHFHRTDEAIEHCQLSIRLMPEAPIAYSTLGTIYDGLGRTEDALAEYEKALRIAPQFSDAHNNYGIALMRLERKTEAIEHFRAAIEAKPGNFEARHNLGRVLSITGDKTGAIEQFQAALALNPNYMNAYEQLALTYNQLGRRAEAIGVGERALAAARALRKDELVRQIEGWLLTLRRAEASSEQKTN